jgi:hypothetical protein
MFESDSGTFDRAFKRVCGAYRLKLNKTEAEELSQTYFKVLAPWPLDQVLAAGKQVMATCKRFPVLADWIAELPAPPSGRATSDSRYMTAGEMDDHDQAAAMRYVGDPCGCADCVDAGIQDRPIRFVLGDDDQRAFHSRRNQIELIGHWAHGEELARWYAARDHFFSLGETKPRIRRLLTVVRAILEREPGMEG